MINLLDQISGIMTSQLIKGISRVLKKLLAFFNGTAISIFALLKLSLLFVSLGLNLNDSKIVTGLLGGCLWCCHKFPDLFA